MLNAKEIKSLAASVRGAKSAGIETEASKGAMDKLNFFEEQYIAEVESALGMHSSHRELMKAQAIFEAIKELQEALSVDTKERNEFYVSSEVAAEIVVEKQFSNEAAVILSEGRFVPVTKTKESDFNGAKVYDQHGFTVCDGYREVFTYEVMDETDPRYAATLIMAEEKNKAADTVVSLAKEIVSGWAGNDPHKMVSFYIKKMGGSFYENPMSNAVENLVKIASGAKFGDYNIDAVKAMADKVSFMSDNGLWLEYVNTAAKKAIKVCPMVASIIHADIYSDGGPTVWRWGYFADDLSAMVANQKKKGNAGSFSNDLKNMFPNHFLMNAPAVLGLGFSK